MVLTSILSFPQGVRDFFTKQLDRWLAKRIPSNKEHTFNRHNIMIYPTRFGLAYLCFVVLVFLLGTNYQNNIILLFSYLLISLFISVMFHSFYNFSQLKFHSMPEQHGFAENPLYFPINIIADKAHYDLTVHFTNASLNSSPQKVEQCQQGIYEIKLPYKPLKRGEHLLGRVTVFSEYSLGLFKSKTVLDFGHYAIVYPKPITLKSGQYQLSNHADEPTIESYQAVDTQGTDDFSELKSFVQGESRARTAWKQLAKGQGHFSKHYETSQGQLRWLKLDEMPGSDVEIKLAYLSFLIGELTASNQTFGLALCAGNTNNLSDIAPNSGVKHQKKCLTALALYS
jgi:uncharacterized protein (DUF58 family)